MIRAASGERKPLGRALGLVRVHHPRVAIERVESRRQLGRVRRDRLGLLREHQVLDHLGQSDNGSRQGAASGSPASDPATNGPAPGTFPEIRQRSRAIYREEIVRRRGVIRHLRGQQRGRYRRFSPGELERHQSIRLQAQAIGVMGPLAVVDGSGQVCPQAVDPAADPRDVQGRRSDLVVPLRARCAPSAQAALAGSEGLLAGDREHQKRTRRQPEL